MRWIRRLFVFFCLIATCLVVWGAVYARKEGFTQSWRSAIEREFTKRGYHVEIGKITLGAFRGLVAEDVTFFQDAGRDEPIALLDDVYLDVDLSRIFQKQVLINTLDVQDASLSLPLDPGDPNGKRLHVENLSGRIVVTESMIEIVKAEAAMADFDIDIKGSLLRDVEGRTPEEEEKKDQSNQEFQERRRQLLGMLKAIEQYEFLGERPRVSIEFRGDLEDLATTTATARVDVGRFRKKGQTYEVSDLSARLKYDGLGKRAEVEELIIRDGKGELTVTGKMGAETEQFEFNVQSTADVSSLVGMFWNDRRLLEVVFFSPPEITASGFLDLEKLGKKAEGFPGEIMGEFQAERFVTRGTVFAGLDFGFSVSGDRFYVRNLRLDHQSGVAFLNLKYEPGKEEETVQYQSEIKLDPHAFRAFFNEAGRKFIDAWDFSDASNVYVAIAGQGNSWSPRTWSSTGVIDLRNFRLNGVDFLEMETDFESAPTQQWFRNVSLVREEGRIFAKLAQHDSVEKLWKVEEVVSTVDPIEGARAFSAKLATALTKYQFESPPRVEVEGTLDARRVEDLGDEIRRTQITISFTSESVARYSFLGETITSNRSSGEVEVDQARVHLKRLSAEVFGGILDLEYDAKNVRSASKPFDASVRLSGVPLEAMTSLYANTEEMKGTVEAVLHLSGNSGEMNSLNGHGTATISNGNLFAIPLLGPLSSQISKSRPDRSGSGANVAREATATLQIKNGVIESDDFEALTDSWRVRVVGTVSLVDQTVDLEAIVNTKGALASAVLTPVSELLTFSCSGTVTEPEWKAKHISNLGKVPAQVINELTSFPREGLKKLGQGLLRGSGGSLLGGARNSSTDAVEPEPEAEANASPRSTLPKLFPRKPIFPRKPEE